MYFILTHINGRVRGMPGTQTPEGHPRSGMALGNTETG